mgnify:CR=1 FL=1
MKKMFGSIVIVVIAWGTLAVAIPTPVANASLALRPNQRLPALHSSGRRQLFQVSFLRADSGLQAITFGGAAKPDWDSRPTAPYHLPICPQRILRGNCS